MGFVNRNRHSLTVGPLLGVAKMFCGTSENQGGPVGASCERFTNPGDRFEEVEKGDRGARPGLRVHVASGITTKIAAELLL